MAYKQLDSHYISIQKSIERIEAYHQAKQNSWFNTEPQGAILGQKITPIESIGVYVPGGKAAYPSSVLMNAIPAKVAGLKNCYGYPPQVVDCSFLQVFAQKPESRSLPSGGPNKTYCLFSLEAFLKLIIQD